MSNVYDARVPESKYEVLVKELFVVKNLLLSTIFIKYQCDISSL